MSEREPPAEPTEPTEPADAAEHDQPASPADSQDLPPPPTRRDVVVSLLRRAVLIPGLAIFAALVIGGLVIVFSTPSTLRAWGFFFSAPLETLDRSWDLVAESYTALLRSSLGSQSGFARTLREMTTLLLAGLSVSLAFRAGLFNIGGAGQITAGALTAVTVGFSFEGLPTVVHLPLALVAGFVGGWLWGAIAGVLKARTGAHEVITTIMLNFVASFLLLYLLKTDFFQPAGRADPISKQVEESARIPFFSHTFPAHWGLALALLAAAGVWWLLRHTTIGFRMRAVGANPHAARYAGMNVGATYALSMGLAGGLAGLGGASYVLGVPSWSLSSPFGVASVGFDAIALALLGRANPAGVVASSFLFAVLKTGSTGMQVATETPVDIIVVIQALIIVFVAAPALVRTIFRVRAERVGEGQAFTTNWGTA
ncbi:MAG: ABC transporter permease subunit [Acidimicrobiales bacterium]